MQQPFQLPNWLTILFTVLLLTACQGPAKVNGAEEPNSQHPPQEKPPKTINMNLGFSCGIPDSEGNIWLGSYQGGLYRYDGTTFTQFSKDDGLCDTHVSALMEDNDGNLWIGTANGICKYDGKAFIHIPIPFQDTSGGWLDEVYPIINPNEVPALVQDRKGNIWIGTGGGGVWQYDGTTFTSFLAEAGDRQSDSLYHNWIPSIIEDEAGNIWFASMTHGGATRFDGETFTQFMPKDGLSDDMIRTLYCDRSGKIWMGANGNRNSGLSCFNGTAFVNYYEKDGLCNPNIMAICEDKAGSLWLGSGREGVCIFDGNTFSEFMTLTGSRFQSTQFIFKDGDDNIWLGGRWGVWRYDGKTLEDMTR